MNEITGDLAVQISALNDLYFFLGALSGLIISGIIKTFLNFLAHRFERPHRIKYGNLNGRLERKTDFEYLYLVKDRYYTLDQRDFLIKEKLNKPRELSTRILVFLVLLFCLFYFTFLYFLLGYLEGF